MNFFDGLVNSPLEELALCTSRVNSQHLDELISIEGRAGCLGRVVTHSASIALKPIYYIGMWTASKYFLSVLPNMTAFVDSEDFQKLKEERKEEATAIQAFIEHEELRKRYEREVQSIPYCALTAPFSQIIQVVKATGGIIYPGIYYKNDELGDIFLSLAGISREVCCSDELVESFEKGTSLIQDKLFHLSNRDYYLATFYRDFSFINEKLKDEEIPPSRKQLLLSMLDPLDSKSGIKGCAPALGRILEQICSQIDIPSDPAAAIVHLSNQFKQEVINRMIMQSEIAPTESMQDWQKVVNATAHDPSHRGNAIIILIGDSIGLSSVLIERCRKDTLATRAIALSATDQVTLLTKFYLEYTSEQLMQSLLFQLNSRIDGSPGLKSTREQIFRKLCEDLQVVSFGEDQSLEAVGLYYLNKGYGVPSEPTFTDLNAAALEAYARSLRPDQNPFTVFGIIPQYA